MLFYLIYWGGFRPDKLGLRVIYLKRKWYHSLFEMSGSMVLNVSFRKVIIYLFCFMRMEQQYPWSKT